eukprot:TRINITY_DN30887_c0_g1_i1.p3 TRINITY_DN30887_c0_g1~~TRINITY_DN30887_c0_g1_i1.p3  ORF type:complete len:101 (-),score=11.21 TRINITY_DN30887_c0_g1_i1:253-555(-)
MVFNTQSFVFRCVLLGAFVYLATSAFMAEPKRTLDEIMQQHFEKMQREHPEAVNAQPSSEQPSLIGRSLAGDDRTAEFRARFGDKLPGRRPADSNAEDRK